MGRKPCCEKVGLRRGPWTADEDAKLVSYITANGICCWRAIPKLAGLLRCGKSCRLRWTNYLRPDLKRGIFTEEEENLILDLHATLGNRWSRIAAQLPGRTDNEIKNYWNTRLKKRLRSQGLDPATHLPLEDGEGESSEDGDSAETRSGKKGAKPPVRQPRGPKPQLNLCQGKDGPVLLKVPKSTAAAKPSPSVPVPKCEADSSGDLSPSLSACSTVTVGSHEPAPPTRKLSSVPSYPEAELWKCIKPSATTASSALSTAALLDEWDSYSLFLNPYPMAPKPQEIQTVDMLPSFTSQQDFGAAACFAQPEMSWSMDVEMAQPAPESLFTLPPTRELMAPPHHPSQDLQKLAALLDLI